MHNGNRGGRIDDLDTMDDRELRYLMDELTDADREALDAERQTDADLDERLGALGEIARLVKATDLSDVREDGEMLNSLAEVHDAMSGAPVLLHDGARLEDPDQALRSGAGGMLAAQLAKELVAAGWVVDDRDEFRSFRRADSERSVLFPFGDDAWLGPRVLDRYRQLTRRGLR